MRSTHLAAATILLFCLAGLAAADIPGPGPRPRPPRPEPPREEAKPRLHVAVVEKAEKPGEAVLRIPRKLLPAGGGPGAAPAPAGAEPRADGNATFHTIIAGLALSAAAIVGGLMFVRGRGGRGAGTVAAIGGLALAGLAALLVARQASANRAPIPTRPPVAPVANVPENVRLTTPIRIEVVEEGDALLLTLDRAQAAELLAPAPVPNAAVPR